MGFITCYCVCSWSTNFYFGYRKVHDGELTGGATVVLVLCVRKKLCMQERSACMQATSDHYLFLFTAPVYRSLPFTAQNQGSGKQVYL